LFIFQILNLERESIELAHIWPKPFPSQIEGQEKLCCYWFVGLVIKTPANASESGQNLDLTTPIKTFTELVMRAAILSKMWKEGMKVEAVYKKRKQLAPYLPIEERHKLKTERKASTTALMTVANSSPRSRAGHLSNDSSSPNTPNTAKRRPSDQDNTSTDCPDSMNSSVGGGVVGGSVGSNSSTNGTPFDVQPPTKRSNTAAESSEIANGVQVS
jgi:hypothetical protein